jgi:membrane associated rhomboid family serine protease
MLPIKDTIRARSFPIINWVLIISNAIIFWYETRLGPQELDAFIDTFGLIPAYLEWTEPITWYPLLSHMFLHGGWLHLLSNLWMLFIFGDNVEDRLGSYRFLVFYLIGGILAGLVQSFISLNPFIPSIGASGAIAAVLGAYILFYPRAKVITIIPIFFIPWFIELPALIFLGIWFVSQLYSGLLSLAPGAGVEWGGVAWWAHIGGFVAGLILAKVFELGRRPERWYPDEYYPW